MRKTTIVLLACVTLVFAFIYLKPADPLFELAVFPASNQSSVQFTKGTILLEKDRNFYFSGTIENNSDIPVTLVEVSLACDEKEISLIIANELEEISGDLRYMPQEIPIDGAYSFIVNVKGVTPETKECTAKTVRWSKYGIKE